MREDIKTPKNHEKLIVCPEKLIIGVRKTHSLQKKCVFKLLIVRYFKC